MRKLTFTFFAGAAALAVAGPAMAQGRQAPPQDLTRVAVQQQAAQAFDRLDANDDGKIDAADRESRHKERFARLDANADGELDQADREARRKAMFARVDADGNGGISYDEFIAQRGHRGPDEARAERGMRGGPGGDRMSRRGMRGQAMGMRTLGRNADTDNDGAISQAELSAAILARFDAADADKNGTVTAAERRAQRDTMRERMRERRAQRAS